MSGTEELTKVFRKTASSGKLDYVPVVVLNETSKTKLHILGFLIPHSDHTGFKVKLEGFTRVLPRNHGRL